MQPDPGARVEPGDTAPPEPGPRLPAAVYRLRILGMGLAIPPTATVLHELNAPWPAWAWLVASSLLWPHIAYLLARRSADPHRAELRNLLLDSAIAGIWAPVMHFNLLPSVLLTTLATVDKINTGIRRLWAWSLPLMAAGILVGGLATGFAFRPDTSMAVVLACMPLLLIHTIAVSLNGYRLVRKVQHQNRRLAALNQVDALTGLHSRGHWERQALELMQRRQADSAPASLLLIDLDGFKAINDSLGHAEGDDVLRRVGEIVQRHVGNDGFAGRFGGDEFVVAIPQDAAHATRLANRIRLDVREFPLSQEGPGCSLSVGIAEAGTAESLRDWVVAADAALYRAKHLGRDRVDVGTPPAAATNI
jgi:diguanylate cyclase